MSIKVLLNGAGRVGKAVLKQLLEHKKFEITIINDINPYIENLVYSINYDSTYGKLADKFKIIENNFIKNSTSKIKITNVDSLNKIDLKDIDIIIDSSGKKEDINLLKQLPVNAVFLTHPNKDADINVILGANEKELNPTSHKIISTSSCNATALLPALKLVDEKKRFYVGIL